jgi:membrane-associated phospholipid phosphatase
MIYEDKSKEDFVNFTKSVGISLLTSSMLKLSVRRERPNRSDKKSFPSGHTTMAFAPSLFIAKNLGWNYAILPLIASTFVGYSRVQARAHFVSDVLVAVVISYLYANVFTSKNVEIGFSRRSLSISLKI